jgi:hypothetical protein
LEILSSVFQIIIEMKKGADYTMESTPFSRTLVWAQAYGVTTVIVPVIPIVQ